MVQSNDNSFLYGYGDGIDSHILSESEQLQFAEFLNGLAPAGSGSGAAGCASSGGLDDQPPPPPPPLPPSYQHDFEHSEQAYRSQPPSDQYAPSTSWRAHDGPDPRAPQQQQQQQQQHYYHHQHYHQQHPQQYSRHSDQHLQYAAHPGQPPLHPLPMTNAPLPYLSDDRTSMIIPAESPKSDRRHSHAGAFEPQYKEETRQHDGHRYVANRPDHHMYLNTREVHYQHHPTNSSDYGATPAIVLSQPQGHSSSSSTPATRGGHVTPSGVLRPHFMESKANEPAAAKNRLPHADEHSQLRRHSVAVAESRRNSIIPAPSPSKSFAGANNASPLSAPPSTVHRPTVLPAKPAVRKSPPTTTTAASPAKKRKRKASTTAVPAANSHPSSNGASAAPSMAFNSENIATSAFANPGASRRWSTISDLSLPAYQPTRPDGEPGDDDQLPSAGGSVGGGGGRGKKSGKPLLTEEEKRANHIESEKKRRQNIRTGFDQLVQIVPTLGQCQRSESLILQKSVEYVQHLMAHQADYQARIAHMRALLGEDGGQGQQSQHQQAPPPQRPPAEAPNDNH
ncbi:hypothetical protein HDU87_001818 [Geranomyces variabilis]|uniref:BHLH domain-containing protein n=1 Tax=Geranomyces variabilis TaxID=109894 RepID=A0AAD5TM92_9FUNG|nr:hypothetical protein HDU87_001818 [Geranomyces variabilis]